MLFQTTVLINNCLCTECAEALLQVQYPDLSEEDLKELFPAKALVSINKLSNRAQAYAIDDELLFFDPEGRGDYLIPTIYALWRFPHMLPTLYTHSQVSTKVIGTRSSLADRDCAYSTIGWALSHVFKL